MEPRDNLVLGIVSVLCALYVIFTVNPCAPSSSSIVVPWYHVEKGNKWVPGAPTFENVSEGESITTVMQHRREMLRLSCDYWTEMEKLRKTGSHEELLEFHRKIYKLDLPKKNLKMQKLRASDKLFIVSKLNSVNVSSDFLICLPPKAGSSNWEKGLAELFLSPNESLSDYGVKEGARFFDAALYEIVPKLFFKNRSMNADYEADLASPDFTEMVNVRNPFTRLHSGWHDKLKEYKFPNGSLTYEGEMYKVYDPIAKEAGTFSGPGPPKGFKVSLESFVNYVVKQPDEYKLNIHFRSQGHSCQQCALNYKFVTHQENSSDEWDWLLQKVGLSDKVRIDGKYRYRRSDHRLAEIQSLLFKHVSYEAVEGIYRRFYTDFVSFGYSPDFVSNFLTNIMFDENASLDIKLRP